VEQPTLHLIQGMTPAMLQRLQNEGFEAAEHLAGADPFKLLLRSNLEWKVILDIIDQAILIGYVGEKIAKLRPLGIRGAIEVATVHDPLNDADRKVKEEANRLVSAMAASLDVPEPGVVNLVTNAYEDVQVNLIWDLWGDASLTRESGAEEAADAAAS
jgi:hypothetical protein